ncbi:unnamed protein product [Closterium sp. Yama58-4]|nr:unnamed protein product [Closterium sp. Yama58-4]
MGMDRMWALLALFPVWSAQVPRLPCSFSPRPSLLFLLCLLPPLPPMLHAGSISSVVCASPTPAVLFLTTPFPALPALFTPSPPTHAACRLYFQCGLRKSLACLARRTVDLSCCDPSVPPLLNYLHAQPPASLPRRCYPYHLSCPSVGRSISQRRLSPISFGAWEVPSVPAPSRPASNDSSSRHTHASAVADWRAALEALLNGSPVPAAAPTPAPTSSDDVWLSTVSPSGRRAAAAAPTPAPASSDEPAHVRLSTVSPSGRRSAAAAPTPAPASSDEPAHVRLSTVSPSGRRSAAAAPTPAPASSDEPAHVRLSTVSPPGRRAAATAAAPSQPQSHLLPDEVLAALALLVQSALAEGGLVGAEESEARARVWSVGAKPSMIQLLKVLREQGVLLAVLLSLSAFFSMAETSITTLWPWKVRELAEKEKEGSVFQLLRRDVTRFLTTILIGTTLVNIWATALVTDAATALFGEAGVSAATGVMTILLLVFTEIAPKSIAVHNATQVVRVVLRPVAWLSVVLYPVGRLCTYASTGLFRLLGLKTSGEPFVTEEELKLMLRGAEMSGAIEEEEQDMIENVLEIKDTYVREVMTPLVDVVAVSSSASLMELRALWVRHQYSRVPVYERRVDNIVGIAYAMDMLDYVEQPELLHRLSVGRIAHRPAYFVPDSMSVWNLLREFRIRKVHMAIVLNEYGGTVGLVTLEDAVEEIVGEIFDENDSKEEIRRKTGYIIQRAEGVYDVDANTTVDDLADILQVVLPPVSVLLLLLLLLVSDSHESLSTRVNERRAEGVYDVDANTTVDDLADIFLVVLPPVSLACAVTCKSHLCRP